MLEKLLYLLYYYSFFFYVAHKCEMDLNTAFIKDDWQEALVKPISTFNRLRETQYKIFLWTTYHSCCFAQDKSLSLSHLCIKCHSDREEASIDFQVLDNDFQGT